MSASLNALPPELLSCIVASIQSQPTLANLALCSRQLNVYATWQLYNRVTIREASSPEEHHHHGQLGKLVSSLIRRPDLAGLVRHFTLHLVLLRRFSFENSSLESAGLNTSDDGEEHPRLRVIARAFQTVIKGSSSAKEEVVNWLKQFNLTHHDLLLAFLLLLLFRVEKVVLDMHGSIVRSYFGQVMSRAARRERPFHIQPPFQMLKVFVHSRDVHSRDFSKTWSPGFIGSLIQLPAIQKVSVNCGYMAWNRTHSEVDKGLRKLDSSSSPLTTLDLALCSLSVPDLGHLLRLPKALTTFSYKFHWPIQIKFTDIRLALCPQKDYLESLDFNYSQGYEARNRLSFKNSSLSMTSFTSFNSLKTFKTAALLLESTDNGIGGYNLINLFPPNLETLHLTSFYPEYVTILEALVNLLVQTSPKQTPSLKTLILEEKRHWPMRKLVDVMWKGTQETAIKILARVGAARGVSIDVIELSMSDNSSTMESESNGTHSSF